MSTYKIENQHELHFLTFTTVGWIDIFTRKRYKEVLINSLKYCIENQKVVLFAYVIMSNHIHLIAKSNHSNGLSGFIRDFKQYTAKYIYNLMSSEKESRRDWLDIVMQYHAKFSPVHKDFQLWQKSYHAIELHSPSWINEKLDYIHLNPVRAGYVYTVEDYIYSSARYYKEQEGPIAVQKIENRNDIDFIHI